MKTEISSGAHTFSEHAKSLVAAQGTSICEPGWAVVKWTMQSRATARWGHQEMPRAPAGRVLGRKEDCADVSQHPKHRDEPGEGDPGPCWAGCPWTQRGRHSCLQSWSAAQLTHQANAPALRFYQPFTCTHTEERRGRLFRNEDLCRLT